MARSSKLKVFRVPIGFHDAYVAAPSQKAAIQAWGSDRDVFSRGEAEVVTDPKLTAEPLAKPGAVVKRLRGTAAEQLAALPPKRDRSSSRKADQSRASVQDGTAHQDTKPPLQHAKPARKMPARPSREALDSADQAIADASDKREGELQRLRAREAALAKDRARIEKAHSAGLEKLRAKREKAAAAYEQAMERWRSS